MKIKNAKLKIQKLKGIRWGKNTKLSKRNKTISNKRQASK